MRHNDLIAAVKRYLSQPTHEQSQVEVERLIALVRQHLVNGDRMGAITGWLWQYSLQLRYLQYMLETNRLVPKWPGGSAAVFTRNFYPL